MRLQIASEFPMISSIIFSFTKFSLLKTDEHYLLKEFFFSIVVAVPLKVFCETKFVFIVVYFLNLEFILEPSKPDVNSLFLVLEFFRPDLFRGLFNVLLYFGESFDCNMLKL